MTRPNTKVATSVDKHIGHKIYELRMSRGKTRQDLGEQIGVTHQQLQKYENGINRIAASRLYEVADVLSVPISHFFTDISSEISTGDMTRQRMCIEVMKDFQSITKREQQEAVRHVIRALIKEG